MCFSSRLDLHSEAPASVSRHTDERLCRYMSYRHNEHRPTRSFSSESTMGRKLEDYPRSDADAFRMRQPPKRDRSRGRLHGS